MHLYPSAVARWIFSYHLLPQPPQFEPSVELHQTDPHEGHFTDWAAAIVFKKSFLICWCWLTRLQLNTDSNSNLTAMIFLLLMSITADVDVWLRSTLVWSDETRFHFAAAPPVPVLPVPQKLLPPTWSPLNYLSLSFSLGLSVSATHTWGRWHLFMLRLKDFAKPTSYFSSLIHHICPFKEGIHPLATAITV